MKAALSLILFSLLSLAAFAQTNFIAVGTKVTLAVSADGTEPIVYTWSKDGNAVTAGVSADGKTLTFEAIALTDAGSYTAKAKNDYGEATSSAYVIAVGVPPSVPIIKSSFGNVSVKKQSDVTLGIVATGDDLKFRWQKGNTLITGADGPSILLRRVNQSDAGTYAVTVSNSSGYAVASGRLEVRNN